MLNQHQLELILIIQSSKYYTGHTAFIKGIVTLPQKLYRCFDLIDVQTNHKAKCNLEKKGMWDRGSKVEPICNMNTAKTLFMSQRLWGI